MILVIIIIVININLVVTTRVVPIYGKYWTEASFAIICSSPKFAVPCKSEWL